MLGCASCGAALTAAQDDAAFAATAPRRQEVELDLDDAWERFSHALAVDAPVAPIARRPAAAPALCGAGAPRRSGVAALLVGAGAAAATDWLQIFRTSEVTPLAVNQADLVALPDLSRLRRAGRAQGAERAQRQGRARRRPRESGLAVPRVDVLPRGVTGVPAFQVGDQAQRGVQVLRRAGAPRPPPRPGRPLPPPPRGLDGGQFRLVVGPGVAAVWAGNSGLPALLVGRAAAPTAFSTGVPLETARSYLLSLPGLPGGRRGAVAALPGPGRVVPAADPGGRADDLRGRRPWTAGDGVPLARRRHDRGHVGAGWIRERGRGVAQRGRGAVRGPWVAVTLAERPPSPAVWCSGLRKRYGLGRPRSTGCPSPSAGARWSALLNGAGKTSVIKMLLGLVHPDAGEVLLLGHAACDPAARTRVGYLPELFRYQPWLTAAEVVKLHVRLSGMSVAAADQHESLAVVGLAERARDRVGGFSKGMQQRLGLAVALVSLLELVILDEPTSASIRSGAPTCATSCSSCASAAWRRCSTRT